MPKNPGLTREDSHLDLWNRVTSNIGLGFLNWPTNVDETDLIWLNNATAFRRDSQWWAEFNAAFFHRNSSERISDMVAEIAGIIGLTDDDEETKNVVSDRAELFLNKIIVGRKLSLQVQDGGVVPLPPSGSSGISAKELMVPFNADPTPNSVVKLTAILPPNFKEGSVETDLQIAEPEGWAVISDIDDTIKISDTLSLKDLLRHTFAEPAQATLGFPDFYRELNKALENPVWFYLSASPYNLYPLLSSFVRETYPHGELILRDMSWMSVAGLMASVSTGTQEYKTLEMKKIIGQWLPSRKYICIGDSTQKDPESYAEMYRKFPGAIKAIWIRVVSGVDEAEEKKTNDPKRFEKAFEGVPKDVWKTFIDVQELAGLAERLQPQ